ncbi:MAG: hypothetical protein WC162_11310 [Sphaerochaetaceae bacterium]
MNTFITILVTILLGLLGITKFQTNKIKEQKNDLENSNNLVKKKDKELEAINEVQQKIKKVKSETKPKKKNTPKTGDSTSRLDRLNKLHDN